jgi:hypothetical protein
LRFCVLASATMVSQQLGILWGIGHIYRASTNCLALLLT